MLTIVWGHTEQQVAQTLLLRLRADMYKVEGDIWAAAKTLAPYFLLVPAQYSHEMERKLCQVCGDRVSLYAEVLTFERLAGRVLAETGGLTRPVLDRGGRLLTLFAAAENCRERLRVYAQESQKPEFLSRLLATLQECKCQKIIPQDLFDLAAEKSGRESAKYHDIAVLLEAYEALTTQSGLDPRDLLDILAAKLPDSSYCRTGGYFLHGFSAFNAQEWDVLSKLVRENPVTVGLCGRAQDTDEELFAPVWETAERLRRFAREAGIPIMEVFCEEELENAPEPQPAALRYIADTAFRETADAFTGVPDAVAIWRVSDPMTECHAAATTIMRLVRDEGYRFRDIYLTARRFAPYRALWEQTAAEYDIPVFFDEMDAVEDKPFTRFLRRLTEVIVYRFPTDSMLSLLKSGLTGLSHEDMDALESYITIWNIRGALWTRPQSFVRHPRGFGSAFTPTDNARLSQIQAARESFMTPLLRLYERTRGLHTAQELLRALVEYLASIGISERLQETCKQLELSGYLKEARETEQLWAIFEQSLRQCVALLGERTLDFKRISELLLLTLSAYEVGSIPVSLDRVACGSCDRSRSHTARVVIVLGATDDAFPSDAPSVGLMDEEDILQLHGAGLRYGRPVAVRQAQEMYLLYQTLTRPSEKMIVMVPQRGAEGEENEPSVAVDWLMRHLGVKQNTWPPDDTHNLCNFKNCFAWLSARPQGKLPEAATRTMQKHPVWGPRLERVLGFVPKAPRLSPQESWTMLSGPLSITRLEQHLCCPYAHFLRYALQARSAPKGRMEAQHVGLFLHHMLEYAVGEWSKTPTDRDSLWHKARGEAERMLTELRHNTERDDQERAQARHLHRLWETVLEDVLDELGRSAFVPLGLETRLESDHTLGFSMSGVADRLDGFVQGDTLYLRVMDYKSGRKDFRLQDFYHGFGLQMPYYLFALSREKDELRTLGVRTEQFQTVRRIQPAGFLYVPARDDILGASRDVSEETLRALRMKNLKRSGLLLGEMDVLEAMEKDVGGKESRLPVQLLKDGSFSKHSEVATRAQFDALRQHMDRILRDTVGAIRGGDVRRHPVVRGGVTHCERCDYDSYCAFDRSLGDCARFLKPLAAKDVWTKFSDAYNADAEGGV